MIPNLHDRRIQLGEGKLNNQCNDMLVMIYRIKPIFDVIGQDSSHSTNRAGMRHNQIDRLRDIAYYLSHLHRSISNIYSSSHNYQKRKYADGRRLERNDTNSGGYIELNHDISVVKYYADMFMKSLTK